MSELEYKQKYLKYKQKYLELKKNIEKKQIGGMDYYNIAKKMINKVPMKNIAEHMGKINPAQLAKFIPNINPKNLETLIPYLKTISPEFANSYNQLEKSGLITDENKQIIFEILKNSLSHLADPQFYVIVAKIFENVAIFAVSTETIQPEGIAKALAGLYSILSELKSRYPNDFVLISTFIEKNKNQIFKMVNYNIHNPIVSEIMLKVAHLLVN